ncbi:MULTISPECIES: LON peptidase substrate-binding domain-containing protein [Bradyrhizobium]|uniref:LON peptidase substrate-binding domain-containing protein n=1 Tax=Bradyrhizobium TaxID=374 RepID=UPI00155E4058|nr:MULTISPECIES: LON peptidase substrate-binding domain-containing protein [Bradyrhizobium]MDD1522534.1 ATP-dependent protease [Bradyrhizobium sp. WBAH30]MDD1546458.1 ATP-dependent protease [Bradyrhizobium sp. WBAH41]MDD1559976.1 ATP-dependent protease [Bradyrhizobium sp. WBAH23]MDD1567634.1 ATP-dependent protease [Bradyrhizobium sp. WBAH33]MDD1593386.1 ATP-dependent protease [Bradyrhizobium sp. WBAH42]
MRDFRDAKAMAHTLRESLTTKAVTISHSESLELVSRMLGVADWNTLSALLHAERRDTAAPVAQPKTTTALYPAVPLRDLVPFPNATYPMFVGRESSFQALNQAFEGGREVVLAVQREAGVDDPRFSDVYDIGIVAQLLELEPLADGTFRVLTRGLRRVELRGFATESAAYWAEVVDVSEGVARNARDLIQRIYQRFQDYTAVHGIIVPDIWLFFDQTRDPGQIADIVATRMKLPIKDKYELLAMLDPMTRLERIEALLDLPQRPVSANYVATKRRALDHADRRRHQYATLEHLLLALTDDADASAVMSACDADLGKLRQSLTQYLDNELKHIVIEGGSAVPTPAFERVDQRAVLHAQEVGNPAVTGVNALVALFPEMRSPAARMLADQGVSRFRVDKAIVRLAGKEKG